MNCAPQMSVQTRSIASEMSCSISDHSNSAGSDFFFFFFPSHFAKISQRSSVHRDPIHSRVRFQSKVLSHTWRIFLISPSKTLQLKTCLGQKEGKNLIFLFWLHLPSLSLAWQHNQASSKVSVPFHWRGRRLKTKSWLTSHIWLSLPDLCCDIMNRRMKIFYCLSVSLSADKEIILLFCTSVLN